MRNVRGSGLEIGPAVSPSILPPGTQVRYVDKYDVQSLAQDPSLRGLRIVQPDILASADALDPVETDSQDFVLAFHVMEHVEDPLAMIQHLCRVTRPGGTIILSVPDKRATSDRHRPPTTFEHLVQDHENGPEGSREDHFREVGRLNFGLEDEALDAYVAENERTGGHTHFHVWTPETYREHLLRAREYLGVSYEMVESRSVGGEVLCVLRVDRPS